MDRLIYTAMTGAKHIMEQQANTANNLANASTTGFRAQLDSFRAVPILGDGYATRAYVVDATVGTDFTQGSLQQTGRDLDVAVQGKGWLAVTLADGSEAYTRAGGLQVDVNGVLTSQGGLPIAGENGLITIPPRGLVAIGSDGTLTSNANGTQAGQVTTLGRLKLVNPPDANMVRGDDGLFRQKSGAKADFDPNVKIASGMLEGSNVNVVESMVTMISLGRSFETQMSMLKNAESNAQKAGQILALS
jgi:flagellar basal-body rod protein FlgF